MRKTLLIVAALGALALVSTSALANGTRQGISVNGRSANTAVRNGGRVNGGKVNGGKVNGGKVNGGRVNGVDEGRTGVHASAAQAVNGRLVIR